MLCLNNENIIFHLTLIVISLAANAQPGTGCFRTLDGFYYTEKSGSYYDFFGNKYQNSTTVCPRVSVGMKTGNRCQFAPIGNQYDEYDIVIYTATGPVKCGLDQYAYAAVVICGLYFFRRLRKVQYS